MSEASVEGSSLRTERVLSAAPREVFAAFERADLLARWWGPEGFTNTFERFAFEPGGRWVFVMHGPDGRSYPNEAVFREVDRDARVVIEHVVAPWFVLTVSLAPRDGGTRVAWEQTFESSEVAARLRAVCEPSNEQNLDRLAAVLADARS